MPFWRGLPLHTNRAFFVPHVFRVYVQSMCSAFAFLGSGCGSLNIPCSRYWSSILYCDAFHSGQSSRCLSCDRVKDWECGSGIVVLGVVAAHIVAVVGSCAFWLWSCVTALRCCAITFS